MLDVAATFGSIDGRAGIAGEFPQRLEGLIERDSPACRQVEHLAGHLRRGSLAGQEVDLDDIVDVGEITALLAVAKDRGLLPTEHVRDELRQHARVGRRRILPWTKNVEVA